MKRTIMFFWAIFLIFPAFSQVVELTLDHCLEKAGSNHPYAGQDELIDRISELNIKNINKNYLPDLSLKGKVSYQSDVTKVPTTVPFPAFEIKPIDKDWYTFSIDLQQAIYDGGTTKSSRIVEESDREARKNETEVEIYKVKERVSESFFNILVLQERKKVLELHMGTLDEKISEVQAAVNNGTLLSSDLDQLKAEKLRIGQGLKELEVSRLSLINILSELVGESIDQVTVFVMPADEPEITSFSRMRPEYQLLEAQKNKLEALKRMSSSRDLPRFYAFGQLGYGRPGYDMLNNNFDDFYMVGVTLNWKFWNWNSTRNEKAILELNKQMIDLQQKNMDQAIRIQLETAMAEIMRYEMLIQEDREIVELREGITSTYEAKLAQGIITSADYLSQLNAESEARLNLRMHEIQLAAAKMDYVITLGEL